MKDQFIVAPPNQYHPGNYKVILVEDSFFCFASVPIRDATNPTMLSLIRRQMEDYISARLKTKPIRKFTHRQMPVEIYFNKWHKKFFWVTGEGPERFNGACDYFATPQAAEEDIRREIDLNTAVRP